VVVGCDDIKSVSCSLHYLKEEASVFFLFFLAETTARVSQNADVFSFPLFNESPNTMCLAPLSGPPRVLFGAPVLSDTGGVIIVNSASSTHVCGDDDNIFTTEKILFLPWCRTASLLW
jgi:hypothetical protein